jgi:hypothetical protein
MTEHIETSGIRVSVSIRTTESIVALNQSAVGSSSFPARASSPISSFTAMEADYRRIRRDNKKKKEERGMREAECIQ